MPGTKDVHIKLVVKIKEHRLCKVCYCPPTHIFFVLLDGSRY